MVDSDGRGREWWAVKEEGGRRGDGVVGVWARRRALLSCPRCCVVVPYCRRASLSHVAVAYNQQQRTTTNVVVRRLVGPFAAVVFAVVHCRLVVVMSWYCVSWSRFGGDVCCGCVHKIYHDDKR